MKHITLILTIIALFACTNHKAQNTNSELQQSTVNSQQSTVNGQQSTDYYLFFNFLCFEP